jgi:hypothetical protein
LEKSVFGKKHVWKQVYLEVMMCLESCHGNCNAMCHSSSLLFMSFVHFFLH